MKKILILSVLGILSSCGGGSSTPPQGLVMRPAGGMHTNLQLPTQNPSTGQPEAKFATQVTYTTSTTGEDLTLQTMLQNFMLRRGVTLQMLNPELVNWHTMSGLPEVVKAQFHEAYVKGVNLQLQKARLTQGDLNEEAKLNLGDKMFLDYEKIYDLIHTPTDTLRYLTKYVTTAWPQ